MKLFKFIISLTIITISAYFITSYFWYLQYPKQKVVSLKTDNVKTKSKETIQESNTTDYKELPKADLVEVVKSKRKLYLKNKGKILRTYHIALGDNPKGHKVQEGDERTPEGTYSFDYKNEKSIAYRSIHITYPNNKDKARAKKLGVKPGGDIMIHGILNGYEHITDKLQKRDWTDGCIAVTNPQMDEIMHLVDLGTPITIKW